MVVIFAELDLDHLPVRKPSAEKFSRLRIGPRRLLADQMRVPGDTNGDGILQKENVSTFDADLIGKLLERDVAEQGGNARPFCLAILNHARAEEDVFDDEADVPGEHLFQFRNIHWPQDVHSARGKGLGQSVQFRCHSISPG